MAMNPASPLMLAAKTSAEPEVTPSDCVIASFAGSGSAAAFFASAVTFFFTGVGSGGGGATIASPSLQQTTDRTT
eukprot:CAMPEP_0117568106 /NCGR_PEP_ID=MMETSP0784-20121206/57961_1 /TAXON_ID=39447 /ORGANISM="" /LENGTH=74 /DNA_ID=CAMNT_0005366017 /DNA_START=61 /DNA_END=281 /DNA_ORIENTATION=+